MLAEPSCCSARRTRSSTVALDGVVLNVLIIDEMSRLIPASKSGAVVSSMSVVLAALAAAVDGLLAGASLDQSIKQLPARHRIGVRAFSAYSRASDQANGVVWYAALGVGGAVLTLAAAATSVLRGAPNHERQPLLLAGLLSIAHSLTTARAAPINFSQGAVGDDERALQDIFDSFERWQTMRVSLQLATFLAMLWALAAASASTSSRNRSR
jgi:hypothetical protein